MLQGVEALLRQLCVRWLVLPSIRTVLPMWRYSFSFIPLTLEEQAALEPHIVSPGKWSDWLEQLTSAGQRSGVQTASIISRPSGSMLAATYTAGTEADFAGIEIAGNSSLNGMLSTGTGR